jgi:hypothetical protein
MLHQPAYLHSRADFERTIRIGETTESIVLDFKKTLDPRAPDWQKEVCRDIAQFANTWGGCLLVGLSERFDPARNVKVADAAAGVQDADKVRECIETAVQNHVVPSSLAHDVVPIQLAGATLVAVNVEPSRRLVYVWDRSSGTFECVRRTSHGKAYMNPDETERHMMSSSRARMLGLNATLAKATSQPNVRVAGGYYRATRQMRGPPLEPWRPTGLVRIPRVDEDTFELTVPVPTGIQSLYVPYDLLRTSWLDPDGQVVVLLDVRLVLENNELILEPYDAR